MEHLLGLLAAVGFEHAIAACNEEFVHAEADALFVVDDQYPLAGQTCSPGALALKA
ncbi:MAG: hypothetical protein L0H23_06375 [Luteimonas sp.]|nr:hypothetical protein [Luteimonas sp.]